MATAQEIIDRATRMLGLPTLSTLGAASALTAQDIVDAALQDIGVYDASETPSDDDRAATLEILNGLYRSLTQMGIDLSYTTTLLLAATIPSNAFTELGLRYGTAIRVAPVFGLPVPGDLAQLAADELKNMVTASKLSKTDTLDFLNDLLSEWSNNGLNLSYSTALTASTTMPTPAYASEAIVTNLALKISALTGVALPGQVAAMAVTSLLNLIDLAPAASRLRTRKFRLNVAGTGSPS